MNNKIVKLVCTLLCLSIFTCGFTGCGSQKNDTTIPEVVFWAYEPQSLKDKQNYQDLINKFIDETSIKVKVSFVPKDSFNTKLNSAIANEKGPDVSYLDQPLIAGFAKDGTILDIKDMVNSSEIISAEDFFESAYNTNVIDDNVYGLPLNLTTNVLLYNKKIITEDMVPSNWDEWLNTAKYVFSNTDKAAFEGIGNGGYAAWHFQSFVCSAGGNLANEDQTAVTFNSESGIKAAEFLYKLYEYSPKEIRSSNSSFGNGNAAFKLGSGSDIDSLEKNFPSLDFGAVKFPPMNEGDTSYSNIGGENIVMYNSTSNKEDAFKLMEFLSQKENAEKISLYTGNFSALKSLAVTDNEKKAVVLDQMNTAVPRPKLDGWIVVNDSYIGTALESILAGKDAKESLDTAAEQATQKLFKEN